MRRSVLARSQDDGRTWTSLYDLSAATADGDMTNAKFINVSIAEINAEDWPGLPSKKGKTVLIWGSGVYRKSNVCLACIPSAQIADKSALRYYSGLSPDGAPIWEKKESRAKPLFDHPVIGEFSTAWAPPVARWIMLYNSSKPRGITMRTAKAPWGPYAQSQIIMQPWNDGAYGKFMHVSWQHSRQDEFHDKNRQDIWGGEYGPYIIARFTTGDSARCEIFYTMSTWNPYQVVLMRSEVGMPSGGPYIASKNLVLE